MLCPTTLVDSLERKWLSIKTRKDATLFLLMSNCTDFEGEESLLQSMEHENGSAC
jgi:hypothetical protein